MMLASMVLFDDCAHAIEIETSENRNLQLTFDCKLYTLDYTVALLVVIKVSLYSVAAS